MKILVTGGLGVNGCWATRRLVADGHDVVVVDRRSDLTSLGPAAPAVTLHEADINDRRRMADVIDSVRPQVVVHMAALVGAHEPLEMFDINAAATVALLDAARMSGVKRFVFTSSRAVYGDITGAWGHPHYRPVPEGHPFAPMRAYDVAKIASEYMGQLYQRVHGVEFTALRFASIIGPGKTVRHAGTSIYSSMIDAAAAGESVHIPQGGDQRDDVIFVEDVAQAIVQAATTTGQVASAYNISRGVGTTLHDLADAIRQAIPAATITIGPGLDYFGLGVQYYSVLDNTLAASQLGFAPKYDLVTGVARHLELARRQSTPHSDPRRTDQGD